MTEALVDFCRSIQNSPAFLLLGQQYLELETGQDAFLSACLTRYGPNDTDSQSYSELIDSGAAAEGDVALAWMNELSRRISVPRWLITVAGFAWSGVYTSAIDSVWPRQFRNEWRSIFPVYDEARQRPSDPRSRKVLHCTFLFGWVNQLQTIGGSPPLDYDSFLRRRSEAIRLLSRLPHDVTPFGIVAIEGYANTDDWLEPEDLAPVIARLNPRQVHLFSASEGLRTHRAFRSLIASQRLILHEESLAQAILIGQEAGVIRLNEIPESAGFEHQITLNGETLEIPTSLWNRVTKYGIVVDDQTTSPPSEASRDAKYEEFRNFLANSDTYPVWSAYAHNRRLAFEREFESDLRNQVETRLKRNTSSESPVYVQGHTGTGKTVALGRLAYSVKMQQRNGVLFLPRNTRRPDPDIIAEYCRWIYQNTEASTLIIWDGMEEIEAYSRLRHDLREEGVRFVLVGSLHLQDTAAIENIRPTPILAPEILTECEVSKFATFLNDFHEGYSILLKTVDRSFLVALYWLLPETRSPISAGVLRHFDRAESTIDRLIRDKPEHNSDLTTLELAMLQAGILDNFLESATSEPNIEPETLADIREITGLVMVPGQFGLHVPLELLLRAANSFDIFVKFSRLLDMFKWVPAQGEDYNFEVGPRNHVEAEILVRSRLGGMDAEVRFAEKLLQAVRGPNDSGVGNREIDFAVNFTRQLGPKGERGEAFRTYYPRIAQALGTLREDASEKHPRIILQEGALLREWARLESSQGNSDQSVLDALSQAERAILTALQPDMLPTFNRELHQQLLVDLAATYATRAQHILKFTGDSPAAKALFIKVKERLSEARALDPANYFPIDVMRWSTRDAISFNVLDPTFEAEARADLLNAYMTIDPEELDELQRVNFRRGRREMFQMLGEFELADEAFQDLLKHHPSFAHYLQAVEMAGGARFFEYGQQLTNTEHIAVTSALNYILEHWETISQDPRVLDFNFTLWWMAHVGERPLSNTRKTIDLNRHQWSECIRLLSELESIGGTNRTHVHLFFRGLALFHLGQHRRALETFDQIEFSGQGRVSGQRRRRRIYLASAGDGKPQVYNGVVNALGQGGFRRGTPEGKVYVEDLQITIPFLLPEFGNSEIAEGDPLESFHIAFGFRGAIADSASA